jgi:hypothetical protein
MTKIILLACIGLLLPVVAFLQNPLSQPPGILPSGWLILKKNGPLLQSSNRHPLLVKPWGTTDKKTTYPSPFLPRFEASQLPVFCRIEHHLGKKMPMMVKFRLGSVEYVDMLEGKSFDDFKLNH